MLPVTRAVFFLLALTFAAPSAFAMSGEGCGGDCASCHTLSLQEARGLLKEMGQVTSVKPAAVRGLYEVTLVKDRTAVQAYLDYGKKHLIGGQIYDLSTHQLVGATVAPSDPQSTRLDRLDPAGLKSEGSILMGNPKGKKRLFVFTDPECPFCAKMHLELQRLVALEPDLAIYIKMYPLKMHPHAYDKARVILGGGSLELLEKSFAGGKLPAPGARDSKQAVDESMRYAESVGINATPTLVLADGRILPGVQDAEAMRKLLK
jgi:thiol:disulfide interchange protein DsbC